MIRLSGFADEAAESLASQIEATKALGWQGIEARSIDGKNIHDLDEEAFEKAAQLLDAEGMAVNCFGSTIANWGVKADGEFGLELAKVQRAIPRMKRLGVSMVRIMSFAIDLDSQGRLLADQKRDLRFARLSELCGLLIQSGITPVHENCLNYGGIGWRRTLELLEAVPGLKLVFDTGNPCLTQDFEKPFPYPNQDAFEAWESLKHHVVHIHVKDGWREPDTGKEHYVYPGEGPCRVADILADCVGSGYQGWMTIEPHMAAVFHDASVHSPQEERRRVYIEYGRRFEDMLRGIGLTVKDGAAYRKDEL
jgi:sugar phosphate isomerase/epimerase